MRVVVSICCSFGLLCVARVGAAWADPKNAEPKAWSCGNLGTIAVVPEAESGVSCPGQAIGSGMDVNPATLGPGDEDWVVFTAEAGQTVMLTTDGIGEPEPDTYLELYFGCGTTPIAQDDDSGPGLFSRITYLVPVSWEYHAKVRGFDSETTGRYHLALTCAISADRPELDLCSDAYALDRCTGGSLEGDVSHAIDDYVTGDPSCTGYVSNGKDVAYRMDLLAGDAVELLYVQLEFDASMYIVAESGDVATSCVIGADGEMTGESESIRWIVETPGTYWLILDAYGSDTGAAWALDYSITCGPTPIETTSWGDLKSNFR